MDTDDIKCEMRGEELYIGWKGKPASEIALLAYGALTQMDGLDEEAVDHLSLYEPPTRPEESPRATTMARLDELFESLGGREATTLAIGEIRGMGDARKWYDIKLGVQVEDSTIEDPYAVLIAPAEYAPEGVLRKIRNMIKNELLAEEFYREAKAAMEGKETEQPPQGRKKIDEFEDLE